jgi:hypothetical protein
MTLSAAEGVTESDNQSDDENEEEDNDVASICTPSEIMQTGLLTVGFSRWRILKNQDGNECRASHPSLLQLFGRTCR